MDSESMSSYREEEQRDALMAQWIQTTERTPSDYFGDRKDHGCIVVRNGYVEMLVWCGHYESWDDAEGDDHCCEKYDCTYWMPLPNPPTPQTGDTQNK